MTGDEVEISVETIKTLREKTSAGIMACKSALEQTDGDIEKAASILKEQGVALAAKKALRTTNQGLIESYIHNGNRIGALVEINCETDFVARTPDFQQLAHDIAMQVAAMSPTYVDVSDIPQEDNIVTEKDCLMQQPFIKDPTKTVEDMVKETVGKIGENVKVRRFYRISLGE